MKASSSKNALYAVLLGWFACSLAGYCHRAEASNREWAEAMLNVRREFRQHEPPTPSVKPRRRFSLTRQVFEQIYTSYPYQTDWLLQDCGNNLDAWLKQTKAATVERGLWDKLGVKAETVGDTEDPRWLEMYAAAAEKRRAQRLERLKELCPRIVFTKNHTISPSFFAYTEGLSDAQHERHFEPGSALCQIKVDGVYPQATNLVDDPHGRIRDPEVSFDGKRVLFAWKKSDRLDDYHLYELTISTGEIRQLTFGLGVADFEPCYVPSGDIVFSSSRCVQTVDCFKTEVSNLYTCGPDGQHVRRLGFDQVHTVKPSLQPGGKVIYTRWDYNDRGQIYPQGLFEMNPDGTGQTEYYGNNSWFPTTISHARGMEGSDKVLAVAMGHHTWQAGKLILIDVSKGRQEQSGVQLIAPLRETEAARVDTYGQDGDLFQYPYPLNEREFLVAYSPLGGRPGRFSLYYMDIDGNRELLASDPDISCQHPTPLAARKQPPTHHSEVDYRQKTGTYYMQDVYHGPGLTGVERGTIKRLRVVEIAYRAAYIGQNYSTGPGGRAMISTPISIGNGCWDVKRVLGDATVYEDGSALFEAPAQTPLYFQCLDEHNRAVQTMRSWSTLQPGETFSCVGCHENKNDAPLPSYESMAFAAGKERLRPFYGETRGFSFPKEVQPILDAKCVSCHNNKDKERMDLAARPVHGLWAKRFWATSYINLTGAFPDEQWKGRATEGLPYTGNNQGEHVVWISSQSVPEMIPPRSVGSTVSPLVELLLKGHGELSREELDKIIAWIDLGVPYCGDYWEAAAWTEKERDLYGCYEAKRNRLSADIDRNIQAMLNQDGATPKGPNCYRNMAREATASTNSVCRNEAAFAAHNVIDGKRENTGHGKRFPSWGPDKRDDLWLKLEWNEDLFVDRINAYIRADLKNDHDSWWKTGSIELSDGREIPFQLDKTADVQVIPIPIKNWPPQPIRWLKFTKLIPHDNKWCGFTEVEVMGRNAAMELETLKLAKP